MKSLKDYIFESQKAVDDMTKLLSQWTTGVEDKVKYEDIDKDAVIKLAKECPNLQEVHKLSHGTHYLYLEFADNKVSKIAIILPSDKEADVWDAKSGFYSLVDDKFKNEFEWLFDGSKKDVDMKVWRDKNTQITGSGLL